MARPIDALYDEVGAEDPWLALLLGCVAWSRSLSLAVGTGEPPADARSGRPEPALLALLGAVSLDRRLRAHLGDVGARDVPAGATRQPAGGRRGLLR